jgi:hypothetical protein
MQLFCGWPDLSGGQQKTTQMDDKLLIGWMILSPSTKKKLFLQLCISVKCKNNFCIHL